MKQLINYSNEGEKLRAIGEKLAAEGKEPTRENVKPLADKVGVDPKTIDALFVEDKGYIASTPCEGCESSEYTVPAKKKGLRNRCESLRILDENEISKYLNQADEILKPTAGTSVKYPIESLGPLASATKALGEHGQVPTEMAGNCILGTAALLAQSRADVRTLAGVKPLSLFLLTVADSGEGMTFPH
jgi:hypothetical protein